MAGQILKRLREAEDVIPTPLAKRVEEASNGVLNEGDWSAILGEGKTVLVIADFVMSLACGAGSRSKGKTEADETDDGSITIAGGGPPWPMLGNMGKASAHVNYMDMTVCIFPLIIPPLLL